MPPRGSLSPVYLLIYFQHYIQIDNKTTGHKITTYNTVAAVAAAARGGFMDIIQDNLS